MVTERNVYDAIDAFAPFDTAEAFDNVGILVDCGVETDRILFSLDVTHDTVDEACRRGCGILVAHHPVFYGGISRLTLQDPATAAAKEGISVVVAHTNYDRAPGGINDVLAWMLELGTISPFCNGLGRIGLLQNSMEPYAFAEFVKQKLSLDAVALVAGSRRIATVAVGGGAYDFIGPAVEAGADALVTGELRHNHGLSAIRNGITAVAAGHFSTENPGMTAMCEYLQKVFAEEAQCLFSETGSDPFRLL